MVGKREENYKRREEEKCPPKDAEREEREREKKRERQTDRDRERIIHAF